MIDPRVGTLGVTAAILLYGAILAGRGPGSVRDSVDLGATPRVIEVDVSEGGPPRRVRAPRALLVGRAAHAEVRLNDPTVSRLHARFDRRDENVYVEDLGSRNGTLVNGTPVVREALLVPGDRVRVGSTDIVYVGVGEWK